jgi:hypothetical protein
MTTDTDHTRALAEEIAQLRRELAEARRGLSRLMAAAAQQEREHQEFRHSMSKAATRLATRIDRLEFRDTLHTSGLENVRASIKRLFDATEGRASLPESVKSLQGRQDRLDLRDRVHTYRLDDAHNSVRQLFETTKRQDRELDDVTAWLREIDMWVRHLAAETWPKIENLYNDLDRLVPQGFAAHDRIPKKSPPSGEQ